MTSHIMGEQNLLIFGKLKDKDKLLISNKDESL